MISVAFKLLKQTKYFKIENILYLSQNFCETTGKQDIQLTGVNLYEESVDITTFENEKINDTLKNYSEECSDISESLNSNNVRYTIESLKKEIAAIPLNELSNLPTEVYNVGPFISRNETLTKLLEFGIDFYQFESKNGGGNILLRLQWDRDVLPVISFLKEQADFNDKQIARMMSLNPQIFRISLLDIEALINYFISRTISSTNIANIISEFPKMLSLPLKEIVEKFSELQSMVDFETEELNSIIIAKPKIVVVPFIRIKHVLVKLRKLIGFQRKEIRKMTLKAPSLFLMDPNNISLNYVFLNRNLALSYPDIVKNAEALAARPYVLVYRVKYLLFLKRYQTDPTKELYTPVGRIVEGDDEAFCQNMAHTSLDMFRKFIKTL